MRPFLFCALMCVVVSATASAAVPSSISVQGRLTDSLGAPLPAGVKGFLFRIFSAPVGGTEIWSGEDQFLPTDSEGLWSAQVGAIAGLTDAVFSDTVRWLDINVNGTQLPRVRLVTGPYAHRVSTVDGASGGKITTKLSIGPGHINTGTNAFVAGENNEATSNWSTISGGIGNAASGSYGTVEGGNVNEVQGSWGAIGGGQSNASSNSYSAVAGGHGNDATGFEAFVGGGGGNTASAIGATVAGGANNTADGWYSTVAGGVANHAYGDGAFIGGGGTFAAGDSNFANGLCAMIPGGLRNRTNGNYAFAAGRRAQANHSGTFVWADSTDADFASTVANQFLIRAAGGVGIGTNDPEAPLHILETSAGAVTANVNSILVLERSAGGWISLVSADASQRGILFSEPTTGIAGGIVFDASNANDLSFRTGGNTTRMTLDATGNLNVTGNITASGTCCASDLRYKKNIATISRALGDISQLRGVEYDWRCDEFPDRNFNSQRQVGLIAQEVREVLPQAVIEQPDGFLAVDYARLVPLLIEGMKEQQRIIQTQNDRITQLEQRLEQ